VTEYDRPQQKFIHQSIKRLPCKRFGELLQHRSETHIQIGPKHIAFE
jgi:hypothetical protein